MIPINTFLAAYLGLYLFISTLDFIIEAINANNLRKYGTQVPEPFLGIINGEELEKINRYTLDKTKFSYVETFSGKIIFLFIILSGLLPWLAGVLEQVHFVLAGLIFFALPGFIGAVADLSFDYYHIFVIEEKYGFNTRTLETWFFDLLKSLLIAVILGTVLLSLLLIMVKYAGSYWWVLAWLMFFAFQILMALIYPTVIAPIFNTFTPLQDDALSARIERLAESEGFTLKGVFRMDAAKRSRHTNAYLSGLGKTKRIVLFDTLMAAHEDDEILAVLAHEMGHLKSHHVKKKLLIMGASSIVLFYLASEMITWQTMYQAFGFSTMPAYAGLFLAGVLWEPIGFFLSPITMAISRRFEREADRHAFQRMKMADSLVMALKKMARDNLSNLRPHPIHVWFNDSHPPLLERIRTLQDMS